MHKAGEFQGKKVRRPTEKELDVPKINWEKELDSETGVLRIVTSRGCLNKCVFCTRPHGLKVRRRSVESIISELNEIRRIKKRKGFHKLKRISFNDDDFFSGKEGRAWAKKFFRRVIEERLHESFEFSVQSNPVSFLTEKKEGTREIDFELLNLMKKANVVHAIVGTDSLIPSLRKTLRKPRITETELFNVIHALDNNFRTTHHLILSYFNSTPEQILMHLFKIQEILKSTKRTKFSVNTVAVPVAGARLFDLVQKKASMVSARQRKRILQGFPKANATKLLVEVLKPFLAKHKRMTITRANVHELLPPIRRYALYAAPIYFAYPELTPELKDALSFIHKNFFPLQKKFISDVERQIIRRINLTKQREESASGTQRERLNANLISLNNALENLKKEELTEF
jgi:hypothetical protein